MSKFDELKKLAEEATQGDWLVKEELGHDEAWCDWHAVGPFELPGGKSCNDSKFIAAANPTAVLELLAIQAQLVEALKDIVSAMHSYGYPHSPEVSTANMALAAAGAQP